MLLLRLKVRIHRFPGLFRQFEFHRMSGLALPDASSMGCQTARSDVLDLCADGQASLAAKRPFIDLAIDQGLLSKSDVMTTLYRSVGRSGSTGGVAPAVG